MKVMVSTVSAGGTVTFRHLSRESLPPGDVLQEGRALSTQQLNDALFLAQHAMSRRPGVGRDAYALGREALTHILGHIVALENSARTAR